MDGGREQPGGEVAVSRRAPGQDFKALSDDLGPAKRAFTEALRVQFRACGLSLRVFSAEYHHDHTTVWRYLTAVHIPDRRFVEDVLAAVDKRLNAPVTVEVQEHLFELHLAALKETSPSQYEKRVLEDLLVAEAMQLQASRRQEQAVAQELDQARAREHQVRMRVRELEAARDGDQIRHGAELASCQEENLLLQSELIRLRTQVASLKKLLDRVIARRRQVEAKCGQLERALEANEQDAEWKRDEELRRAEEKEQARQAEEQQLRGLVAERERELEQLKAQYTSPAGARWSPHEDYGDELDLADYSVQAFEDDDVPADRHARTERVETRLRTTAAERRWLEGALPGGNGPWAAGEEDDVPRPWEDGDMADNQDTRAGQGGWVEPLHAGAERPRQRAPEVLPQGDSFRAVAGETDSPRAAAWGFVTVNGQTRVYEGEEAVQMGQEVLGQATQAIMETIAGIVGGLRKRPR